LVGAAALAFALLGPSVAQAGIADPDPSFGENGLATVGFGADASADAVALAPDGGIVVVGSVASGDGSDFAIASLNPDGTPNGDFSQDGRLTLDLAPGDADVATGVAVRSDGRIVVGGMSADRFAVVQLEADGTQDTLFAGDGTAEFGFGSADYGYARDLALDPSGNVIVVGRGGSEADESQDAAIARLTPAGALDDDFAGDGTLTVGFDLPSGPSTDVASGVVALGDGRLAIAGGHFQTPNGNGLFGRIGADGSVETLKSLGSGRYYAALDVAALADGTPLAVGEYQPHAAPGGSALAWSLASDSETQTWNFMAEPGAEGPVRARATTVAGLADGRAIVGGAIGATGELFLFDSGFVASGHAPFVPDDVAASADGKPVAVGGSGDFTVGRFLAPTIDAAAAPDTKIVAGPRGKVDQPKVKFRFRSQPNDASFQCKLDGRRWRACKSPYEVGGLDAGRHRFRVRAVTQDGERDPTPAKRRFVVR
jgi:uncharacterized delta-60 repeat protein